MYKRVALNGLVALGLLAGASASAEVAPGFYAGAGLGQATVKEDETGYDESDTAFKVFGGYSFNQNFAAEVAYINAGKSTQSYDFGGGFSGTVEAEATGFIFSGVGRIPVSETFSIYGKIGLAAYDVKIRARGSIVGSDTLSENDLAYGVGAALGFGQFEVRGEYEAVNVDGGDFNVLSVSGLYRF